MTVCSSPLDKPSATMRASRSVVPPAANGTTSLTGPAGHGGAACAAPSIASMSGAIHTLKTLPRKLRIFDTSGGSRPCRG